MSYFLDTLCTIQHTNVANKHVKVRKWHILSVQGQSTNSETHHSQHSKDVHKLYSYSTLVRSLEEDHVFK